MTKKRVTCPAAVLAAAVLASAGVAGAAHAAASAVPADDPAFDTTPSRRSVWLSALPITPAFANELSLRGGDAIGVDDPGVIVFDQMPDRAPAIAFEFPIDGELFMIELGLDSVRAPGYQVLVDRGFGDLVEVDPGPINTYRGVVLGIPGSRVSAGVEDDGLHIAIDVPGSPVIYIQPMPTEVDGAPFGAHLSFDADTVREHGHVCGVTDFGPLVAANVAQPEMQDLQGGGLCTAELAFDADFEYFQDYGSVAAVESRINSIMNVVNNQYENETGITHQITTIIVRSSPSDPYTSSQAETLLCQFITEWTNNQGSIQRDVAHLMTGRNISGGTIGIAADIGGTGICVQNGGCSGGTFGTFGSYCLAESDFNNNFGCATDLTAHELGHLWGAFHCFCSGFTMNPSITCANQFTTETENSIIAYRDTRTCLDCGGFPPANDDCFNAESFFGDFNTTIDTTDATPPPGGSDPQLPAGSPSCQWDGTPQDAHSTVWYRFQAQDTSIRIATCDTTDVQDTIIALYSGSCSSLVEIACSEDVCGDSGFLSEICFEGLEPGTFYYIMIGNPGSWAGSLPGLIDVEVQQPCPTVGPVAGACCLPDGSCASLTTPAECASLGGSFSGAGVSCADANCPDTGACCLPSSTCVEVDDSATCDSLGGTWLGIGSTCLDGCGAVQGGCCLPDGACIVTTAEVCATAGGTYGGDGTTCGDVSCGPDCVGDFDGDGSIAFNDLVTLLSAWGPCVGCPADLDGNGEVAFNDLVTLLSAWGPCE